ncbi:MAG: sulfite exporter TauE/SafE family protein [Gammaproteobacteria bacterium]|nr:sulfite exporter TauE/SafE family protein [Gammaproteobacteria bacterium]
MLAGLLGIGGGLIIVPVLVFVFEAQRIDPGLLMHLAVATSLASVVFTAVSSAWAHHRRGAVHWSVVGLLAPGIVLGALLAGWAARYMSSDMMRVMFGVFAIAAAANLARGGALAGRRDLPGPAGLTVAGGIIGGISTLVGIGGGTMTVPFLSWCREDVRTAVGSSAACGFPIAVAGTLALVVAGSGAPHLPEYATGYVYWPAAFAVALAGIFAAPIGARLAHALPVRTLQRVFAVLLVIVGTRLMLSA